MRSPLALAPALALAPVHPPRRCLLQPRRQPPPPRRGRLRRLPSAPCLLATPRRLNGLLALALAQRTAVAARRSCRRLSDTHAGRAHGTQPMLLEL